MVIYKICVFGADRKSNMAARAHNVFWLVEIHNSIGLVVSNKKIFKISTNQNTLWALAAMLDFRSATKTKIYNYSFCIVQYEFLCTLEISIHLNLKALVNIVFKAHWPQQKTIIVYYHFCLLFIKLFK
jgi:hypothetical protein